MHAKLRQARRNLKAEISSKRKINLKDSVSHQISRKGNEIRTFPVATVDSITLLAMLLKVAVAAQTPPSTHQEVLEAK